MWWSIRCEHGVGRQVAGEEWKLSRRRRAVVFTWVEMRVPDAML